MNDNLINRTIKNNINSQSVKVSLNLNTSKRFDLEFQIQKGYGEIDCSLKNLYSIK